MYNDNRNFDRQFRLFNIIFWTFFVIVVVGIGTIWYLTISNFLHYSQNPAEIGHFMGEIVKGFNDTK